MAENYINAIHTECKNIIDAGVCETNNKPCLFLIGPDEIYLTKDELKEALKQIIELEGSSNIECIHNSDFECDLNYICTTQINGHKVCPIYLKGKQLKGHGKNR